ncbi:MAG: metallopeptidase family protein [Actinomycetota bacterium]|nr:metallopeptidase family protein [Actinomycetota bacterium]
MNRPQFERLVDEALEGLPPWVLEAVDNLAVVVEDWPRHDQDPSGELLGLYEGVSLLERGIDYSGFLPDRIVVFMGPHLRLGLPRSELRQEIRRTVLHEIAHHLGLDDHRLHELGWE